MESSTDASFIAPRLLIVDLRGKTNDRIRSRRALEGQQLRPLLRCQSIFEVRDSSLQFLVRSMGIQLRVNIFEVKATYGAMACLSEIRACVTACIEEDEDFNLALACLA